MSDVHPGDLYECELCGETHDFVVQPSCPNALGCVVDGGYGIYVPQTLAQRTTLSDVVSGYDLEDHNTLLAGPDHEDYWEAWTRVLDNAVFEFEAAGHRVRWRLQQSESGDVFTIKVRE